MLVVFDNVGFVVKLCIMKIFEEKVIVIFLIDNFLKSVVEFREFLGNVENVVVFVKKWFWKRIKCDSFKVVVVIEGFEFIDVGIVFVFLF